MRTLIDAALPDRIAPVLAILLPGAYNSARDFQREGFVTAVRDRKLAVDLALVDMTLEFVSDGSALPLLRQTVVAPARGAGYRRIWLVGVSLGGLMAMAYADRHPGDVDGLCLIAPYPGSRIVGDEIAHAGGIASWDPQEVSERDTERRAWRWLKRDGARSIDVHLAYGRDDRFAPRQEAIGAVLPASCVNVVPGGHDWRTWRQIWDAFLDRGSLIAVVN
jgi:enterochelin esterase-like enzyme